MKTNLIRCLVVTLALFACGATVYPQERPSMMVTSTWLADHLHDSNLILLHVGEKGEYEKGHIPGAQSITDFSSFATKFQEGQLRLELLPVDELKTNLEKLGISDDSRIVVYYGKDWASPSTRIIWTLTYMGLGDRTSLLDGGMSAWQKEGHPLSTEAKIPTPGHLTPKDHPEILIDAAYISAHLREPSMALIDVRSLDSFNGKSDDRMTRVGHIPGAQSLPLEALFNDGNQLKPQSDIKALLVGAGAKLGTKIVSYCYVGQRATLVWFLARMLGYDAALYDGSWDEWSSKKDLPVEGSAPPKQNP
jgi:thiosulfate/3-mercaptopyruvate sulfurtransferase